MSENPLTDPAGQGGAAALLASLARQNDEVAAENRRLAGELAAARAQLAELRAEVDRVVEQLKLAAQRQWAPRADRVVPGQVPLFNDVELESDAPLSGDGGTGASSPRRRRRGGKRRVDLSRFETVTIEHELPEGERACPSCGRAMSEMGVEETRRLRLVPAHFVCEVHRRHVYRCGGCCAANAAGAEAPAVIVRADMPAGPVPGSIATASLVSWVIKAKYERSMPLYRIEDDFRGLGADISRQDLANWVVSVHSRWLSPLVSLMSRELLSRDVVHADETTVQVLREPGREPSSRSFVWLFCDPGDSGGPPVYVYEYRPTRSGEVARSFLEGWGGFLVTDGYSPYYTINDHRPPGGPRVTNVACLAHVRRKFADVARAAGGGSGVAAEAVRRIDGIFRADNLLGGLPPDERRARRLEGVRPLMESFGAWVRARLPEAVLGLALSKALGYAAGQWPHVMRALDDGRLPLTNNAAERAIRPFAIGRKNWLFSDTPRGAEASASCYSLVTTARANGLDPQRYLEWLLDGMPNAGELTDDVLRRFLPWSAEVPGSCRLRGGALAGCGDVPDEPLADIDPESLETNRD